MSKIWAYVMLSGSALFWSGNFVIGRAFSADIPALSLSYWRWLIALFIFLPFSIKVLLKEKAFIKVHLGYLAFMGVLGVAGFNTFVYIGLQQTSATNALLINSFIPVLILVFSRLYPGNQIGWLQILGILVSTLGVFTLVTQGQFEAITHLNLNAGDLWILLAASIWAVYSIALRWRPRQISSSSFLLLTMIVGVVVLSPFYWFASEDKTSFNINTGNLSALVYVAVLASISAFLLWNEGVKRIGAASAGQFIHLMPVFGSLLAFVFLGERFYWYHVAGAVAIALGLFLTIKFRQSQG